MKIEKERGKGKLFSPGIEPGTFCVLDRCDNRYTTKTGCAMHARIPNPVYPRQPMLCPRPPPSGAKWKADVNDIGGALWAQLLICNRDDLEMSSKSCSCTTTS